MNQYIESETVELKAKYTDTFVRELVSFLNAEGGIIYIGIQNDGTVIGVDIFSDTVYVDVVGTSKGKGFQGVVKRHGFSGAAESTHGQGGVKRSPGSIGMSSTPSRVLKGKKMAGQMGNERVTVQNLQVIKIIPEHNLLLLKGSVPGANGSIVIIEK